MRAEQAFVVAAGALLFLLLVVPAGRISLLADGRGAQQLAYDGAFDDTPPVTWYFPASPPPSTLGYTYDSAQYQTPEVVYVPTAYRSALPAPAAAAPRDPQPVLDAPWFQGTAAGGYTFSGAAAGGYTFSGRLSTDAGADRSPLPSFARRDGLSNALHTPQQVRGSKLRDTKPSTALLTTLTELSAHARRRARKTPPSSRRVHPAPPRASVDAAAAAALKVLTRAGNMHKTQRMETAQQLARERDATRENRFLHRATDKLSRQLDSYFAAIDQAYQQTSSALTRRGNSPAAVGSGRATATVRAPGHLSSTGSGAGGGAIGRAGARRAKTEETGPAAGAISGSALMSGTDGSHEKALLFSRFSPPSFARMRQVTATCMLVYALRERAHTHARTHHTHAHTHTHTQELGVLAKDVTTPQKQDEYTVVNHGGGEEDGALDEHDKRWLRRQRARSLAPLD